jgi:hypothetical protein
MKPTTLSSAQAQIVSLPEESKIFLEGPAGAGKTTAGAARMLELAARGVPAESVLVIVPQRTLAQPYLDAQRHQDLSAPIDALTIGGLARRMVDLFWPVISSPAGFAAPDSPPTFLTLETTQYFMARQMRPLLDQGYFENIVIDRNRLYSQVLDNLNKSALIGFPHTEIGARLKSAWVGESAQVRVYDEAQECASLFRSYCLQNNLLDFSLQVEIFRDHLWPLPEFRAYLFARYQHLIVDNIEEDTPFAHDLLGDWLPACRSALLIADWEGGYRRFLGADPQSAASLKALCSSTYVLEGSYVTNPDLEGFAAHLGAALGQKPSEVAEVSNEPRRVKHALEFEYHRFYPEMLDWVATQIARLVQDQGVSPGQIAVLAPFMTDSLRFSLSNRLENLGIPARSHRPSRSLRDEPAARCLLTFASLAHPQWGFKPTKAEVTYALVQSIQGLDLVRARLLVEILYRTPGGVPNLGAFDQINPEAQQRITYSLGQSYQTLCDWLEAYRQAPVEELDHFFSRLFGELLSQPGFGFHTDFDAGAAAAMLIESARKFRWVMAGTPPASDMSIGQEYVQMVQDGVIAAQYVQAWQLASQDAVYLAPAYTFLMSNHAVDYQFWLDVGSAGWWERLYQPLTHPYVLSQEWPAGKTWSDTDEFQARQDSMRRLTLGLIRRCRQKIFLGLSELGESGYEQQGPLLRALQQVLRRLAEQEEAADV